jgi:predicted MFS family arabinose efflux permease
VAAVTPPAHRTYALAVTSLVRNVGWAAGPALAGWSITLLGLGAPLMLGAGLKMVYDVALFRSYGEVGEEY